MRLRGISPIGLHANLFQVAENRIRQGDVPDWISGHFTPEHIGQIAKDVGIEADIHIIILATAHYVDQCLSDPRVSDHKRVQRQLANLGSQTRIAVPKD